MNCRRAATLVALLLPTTLAAQASGSDPYAPVVLLLPGSARALGMGNVGVASRDDDVLFYNPAQIAIARGFSASGERLSATATTGALSSVTRFSTGGVALGMRMVDYKAGANYFPVNRESMLDDGAATGTSIEAVIGVAQTFKSLRIGANAKYVEDAVPSIRVGRAAFDLGIAKDMFRSTIGLSVQNLGAATNVPCGLASSTRSRDCVIPPGIPPFPPDTRVTSAALPFKATLGAATARPLGQFDFVGTAAVSVLRSGFWVPAGGAELGYSWLDGYSIALRAGARRPIVGEGTATAGAGFTMDRLSIDYALETLSGSRIGHRIGLRVR
ncbi:MAG: hypothetical protein ABJF01_20525 [bacterium]